MKFSAMGAHYTRLKHQLGHPLRLGRRTYRLRGYSANLFATDFRHEPFMMPVLTRVLESTGGTFVDVGANIGQTFIKVLAIDPDRPYVGFDPQVECCVFINQFITDNRLQHAKVIPIALSNQNRLCTLFSNHPGDDMASILDAPSGVVQPWRLSRWVPARVGDEVFEELGLRDIGVIKIDVEGTELQVLSGLVRTLNEQRPIVVFEVLPNFYGEDRHMLDPASCARNRSAADEILSIFNMAGYRISQIDSNGDEHAIERFDLDDSSGYVGHDFIAIPDSRAGAERKLRPGIE